MMATASKAFRAVTALTLLICASACTMGLGGRSHIRAGSAEDRVQPAQSATQSGRDRLAAGMPGAAVGFFQVALATGEPAAPAFNGLGVGYARLGRHDLALRFFKMAAKLDPGSAAFAANLRIASEAEAARVELVAQRARGPITTGTEIAAAPGRIGRLQRTSLREVRIVTSPPRPAPVARIARVQMAAVAPIGKDKAAPQADAIAPPPSLVRVVTIRADAAPVPAMAPLRSSGVAPTRKAASAPEMMVPDQPPSLARVVTGIRIASTNQPLALSRIAP